MKRVSILLILACASVTAMAQNTFTNIGTNVGIGTQTPPHLLTLKGTHQTTRLGLQYDVSGDPLYSADLFLWASEPGWTYSGTGIGNNVYNSPTGITRWTEARGGSYIRLLDQGMKLHVIDINGMHKEAISIDQTGNVGMGMPMAFERLSVNGSIKTYSPFTTGVIPPDSWIGGHTSNVNYTTVGFAGMKIEYGRLSDADFSSTLKFYTSRDNNPEERMVIDNLGNIGIGTNSQTDYKLAVNGHIRALKLKVTQQIWPDFVFEKEYTLPTLTELDHYITKHHHLPGIPTEKQVKAEGLDVGDMQAKLLQKIEELTLYLIEERKRNDALELRVKSLEKGAK